MVEPIPIENHLYLVSASEFTAAIDSHRKIVRLLVWVDEVAYDITQLLKDDRSVVFGNHVLDVYQWLEVGVPIAFKTIKDLSAYVKTIVQSLEVLKNRSIVVAFSGGKDSITTLLTMLKLRHNLNLDVRTIYVHMPYLEPEENVTYVNWVSSRLGIDVEILEPKKNVVLKYLREEGLPYRRNRWCTYLKTRPMREYMKQYNIKYVAIGDRIWETFKRMARLCKLVERRVFVKKRAVYPIPTLTILDVISTCRMYGFVHPHYLVGATRVACRYCPYKSAYELRLGIGYLEDPGVIDEILVHEWRRWYRDTVPFEIFYSEHLWRYTPKVARMFHELKEYVRSRDVCFEEVKLHEIARLYVRVWIDPRILRLEPKALDLAEICNLYTTKSS